MSVRIAKAVIEEIQRGRLRAGDPLPGARTLSQWLSVNRKTVVVAYDELVAQGWAETDARRGTFVARDIPTRPARSDGGGTSQAPALFQDLEPTAMPLLWPREQALGFDDGLPDPRLIPVDALARAYAGAVRSVGRRRLFRYDDPRGSPEVRGSISRMLNFERGMTTMPESICLTRGSQMALHAVARALFAPGDAVAFEDLTYPPAVQVFELAGLRPTFVRLGAEGIDLDHLEQICRTTPLRAVYLTPHHHFPTTVMLRPAARLRLRALAAQFGFLIIEDDYDHDFHFEHKPMFPLASNDPNGQIVYVGSFSKMLSPSLRFGYVAAAPDIVDRVLRHVAAIDRQGDPVVEYAVLELIESGRLRAHVRRMHGIYRERRDRFADLLTAIDDVATFTLPAGGLAIWIAFRREIERSRLDAAARSAGLGFLSSGACARGATHDTGARLGFGSLEESEMKRGIDLLGRILRNASDRPTVRNVPSGDLPSSGM